MYVTLQTLDKNGITTTPRSFPLDGLKLEKLGGEPNVFNATVPSPAATYRVMIPPGQPIPTSGEPTNS